MMNFIRLAVSACGAFLLGTQAWGEGFGGGGLGGGGSGNSFIRSPEIIQSPEIMESPGIIQKPGIIQNQPFTHLGRLNRSDAIGVNVGLSMDQVGVLRGGIFGGFLTSLVEDPFPCHRGGWSSPGPGRGGSLCDILEAREALGVEQPASSEGEEDQPYDDPKLWVSQDDHGKITRITNLTDDEIDLKNGLILGPRASVDLRGEVKIIAGYVIMGGIKSTADGTIENLKEEEVELSARGVQVILGPKSALSSEGVLLKGYAIVPQG